MIEHADHAGKSWLRHRQWASPEIACNTRTGLWLMWFFAGIWNALSSFVWFVIPEELAKGNHAILIAALFPLVGMGLFGSAIYLTWTWRRFGPVAVALDPYPGAIGGQVGGTIDLRLPYASEHRFSLVLSCLYSYVSGSGKNRSRKEKLVWQATGFAYSEAVATGTRLNFCFDVPADLPESEPSGARYHLWRLTLKANLPGVDLSRQFNLPVFPTAEQSRFQQRNSSVHFHAVEQREALIESVLTIEQVPGGIELFFPMLRHARAKLFWLVFGIIFAGAGIGLNYAKDAPTFLALIFSATGLLIIIFTFYSLFNSLRVRLDGYGISGERRWLGLPLGKHFAPRSEVQQLVIRTSYSRQSGGEHVDVCTIQAHTNSGKKITVAESLQGRNTALQALEAISLLSGYPVEK